VPANLPGTDVLPTGDVTDSGAVSTLERLLAENKAQQASDPHQIAALKAQQVDLQRLLRHHREGQEVSRRLASARTKEARAGAAALAPASRPVSASSPRPFVAGCAFGRAVGGSYKVLASAVASLW